MKPSFGTHWHIYSFNNIILQKVCGNSAYNHLFLESELKTLREIHNWKEQMQLYVRLMNRKDKWNKCSDISYNDISSDLSPLFDFLESRRLVTFGRLRCHFILCILTSMSNHREDTVVLYMLLLNFQICQMRS